MAFVSVTRLRVRSFGYLLQFAWQTLLSARQAERTSGFLGGRLLRNAENTFWTITAWKDETAMNAYRIAGSHRSVMPKLLNWCDEAAVVHWNQETSVLPSWEDAHRRMVKEGKPSKVNYPSPAQASNHIPEPEPSRFERTLSPRLRSKNGIEDSERS